MSVIPTSFHGRYSPREGEVVTAEGPLTGVSIRVSVPNVIIHGLKITGAEAGVSRPAVIDASGSTNLQVEDCTILGDGKQEQGIYIQGGSGLVVGNSRVGPIGADRYFDHSFYLNGCKDFLLEDVYCEAPFGAGLHLYSGGATGIARRVEVNKSRWGCVAWGPGNTILLDACKLHGSRVIEGGRGYGIQAESGATVSFQNSYLWDNEAGDTYAGSGQIVDLGGNTFAAPDEEPPPPPLPPSNAELRDSAVAHLKLLTISYATWQHRVLNGYKGRTYDPAKTEWGKALADWPRSSELAARKASFGG